jgi:signal transduction histidine kinase
MQQKITVLLLRNLGRTIFVLVLVLGLGVTAALFTVSQDNVDNRLQMHGRQFAEDIDTDIEKRLVSYQEMLRGTGGLFVANDYSVSAAQWAAFVNLYRTTNDDFNATQGIGYAPVVSANDVPAFEQTIRNEGPTDYTVTPKSSQAIYIPILYVEPAAPGTNYGSDLFSDPLRRKALDSARDTGEATLTDVVKLKRTNKDGVIMYFPIYRGEPHTVEERRASLIGYSYTGVHLSDLFEEIPTSDVNKKIEYGVVEGSGISQVYSYQTSHFNPSVTSTYRQVINAFNKNWTLHMSVPKATLTSSERSQPTFTLATGIILSVTMAVILGYIVQARSRELNYLKKIDLQEAKDELLSLASHQLRTPATGVKQYIGMILEGYAGKLPKKQRDILSKAYQSNERQLEIVNQILHIARIESGRLILNKEDTDIKKMVREVISEQRSVIRSRKQKLHSSYERKLPTVNVDPHYIRMVIENLVNNASKYTFEKGEIVITVRRDKRDNSKVAIEVSDNGVGIAREDSAKLFQKFSRIHNQLSVSSGGTGIGLYLSKLIMEMHNGTIEVISKPELGSTFRILLPVEKEM